MDARRRQSPHHRIDDAHRRPADAFSEHNSGSSFQVQSYLPKP